MSAAITNIARHLPLIAAQQPDRAAVKIPRGTTRAGDIDYLTLSFAELAAEAAAWQTRLAAAGIARGDRTLVMVRPGLPLIASVFALFALGAVPVVIDPGMGLKSFLGCVARSRPRALVGIPLAQLVSRIARRSFRGVAVRVTARRALDARLTRRNAESDKLKLTIAPTAADDLAAILFTSGSTGAPKGVCYEHGMFEAQVRLIRATYGIALGEIDLPMLPVFALFNPALGMTTVVPEIDPSRPAQANPERLVRAIRQEQVTNSFGSPTLWRNIADYCQAHALTLPSLRRVLCAGAPVPVSLWRDAAKILPHGRLHSPYGATEALPVSSISADDVDPRAVRGACVGRPVGEIAVKIIALADQPLPTLAATRELPSGEIGEIIVSGPVVTKAYDALPEATAAAKIEELPPAKSPGVWHRMGDCGWRDETGRLWFCGRKAERVETVHGPLFTEPCEQVFRQHPRVGRCALIGIGARGEQTPALVVEAELHDSAAGRTFARELRVLAQENAHTMRIEIFYFRPDFPVDVRHNAKIHRLALAQWAATATGYRSEPKR
ncbi:MAG: AMP-binding protein [Opitutae bacterium]|nr:AMP-binding protein [Opitutae bacterium]